MFGTHSKKLMLTSAAISALLLSACSSNGGTRLGSVGIPSGSSVGSPGDGSGGTDTGTGGDTGTGSGTGSGSGGTGSGGTGSTGSGGTGTGGTGTGGTGTGGTGSGGTGSQGSSGLLGGVITTAGNAVLTVGDTAGGVLQPVNATLPATTPITGTIVNVVKDTGQTLVDVGQGKKVLVSGLLGAVGDAVSITALDHVVTSPTTGTGLVGVGLASNSQPNGKLASLGILTDGNSATATINGIAGLPISEVTPGAINGLVQATVGGAAASTGGTPLVSATVLSTTPAKGALVSATLLPTTANGSSGGSGVGAVVQQVNSTVSGVTSGAGSANGLVGVTVGNTTIGSSNPAIGANVLSPTPVSGTVATATVPSTVLGGGSGSGGSGNPVGGVLQPVSAVVSNTVSTVGNVVGGVTGGLQAGAGASAGAGVSTTATSGNGLLGGLLGKKK